MTERPRHLLISYHTCPTERPGEDLAGGMNVLLRGFLETTRWPTEVVSRSLSDYQREVLSEHVTLHRLPCGAARPWTRELALECLPAFKESLGSWLEGRDFDVASAHYWMSGTLLDLPGCPAGLIFHTLQAQKGAPVSDLDHARLEEEARLARRYRCGFLHWHDLRLARTLLPGMEARVLRPGCSLEPALPRSPRKPRVYGWAARPDAIKNFSLALETLRRLDDGSRLMVAGSPGPAWEQVRFLGSLPPEQMASFYDEIDQLWNFSSYETFGLGVLEALTRGATVGLLPHSDWARRLRRLGLDSRPGMEWSAEQRAEALRLARCYTWARALPIWERWLRWVMAATGA